MEIKKILFFFLMFSLTVTLHAQQITVQGTVYEEGTKNPIPGANVIVKGTTQGTSTDFEGHYTLPNVPSNAVLEVSFVGMQTQNVKVAGRSRINVTLRENTQELKEVVVIGYGAAQKRDLTGSIVSLKTDEFADRPSTNPLASIQGKVAGVQIVNTGRAGQDPEIRIRGTNSINGYTPLYVVDELFTDNINYLNPQDIESMEILKDPSSLAIFGVRGANGVIIITTKKAKKGQTVVNINSSVGLKVINDRVAMTDAEGFKTLYDEELANKGANPFDYTHWQANTDWQDEIFRRAWVSNHNVSVATSGEKGRFYMGAGYIDEEGSIKHEKLSKLTLNLSSDYNVTDFLRFGFQANGSRILPADGRGVEAALKAVPIAPVKDENTGLFYDMPNFQNAQVYNPMIRIEEQANNAKASIHRLTGNIYGELKFLKDFTFKATFSADYNVHEERRAEFAFFVDVIIGGESSFKSKVFQELQFSIDVPC
ncbi:Outer membrane receptor for ferrienterochelin and colicins [Capnocytophaga ochracea]|uniref:Outer membrane receptor for ferrienterochelin and colicins n=1 Tax=Capnocytophaga ochracea TaxID=1018 RepID=A0A2X2SVS0_CAPOC|nr:Outer membrane receptor for ferrienterochelin and colicins [Capnocytophaga ochracea]